LRRDQTEPFLLKVAEATKAGGRIYGHHRSRKNGTLPLNHRQVTIKQDSIILLFRFQCCHRQVRVCGRERQLV
jgi:hypothetical protein